MKVMVTGVAGFIGAQASLRLLERGDQVMGWTASTITTTCG